LCPREPLRFDKLGCGHLPRGNGAVAGSP